MGEPRGRRRRGEGRRRGGEEDDWAGPPGATKEGRREATRRGRDSQIVCTSILPSVYVDAYFVL